MASADGPTLPRLSELNPGDESAGATVNVAPVANLRLAKRADVDRLSVGAQATYTLTATNDGPDPASGVVMQDTLPAGVAYEAGSDGCQEQAGVVRCQVGDVAVGASVERNVVVRALRASAGTTLVNSATVAGAEDDLDPADNAAQIAAPAVAPLVDLSLAKSATPERPSSPGQVIYTLTVANAGPSPATGVTIRDGLPDGLRAVSALTGEGSCALGADVTCTLGTIRPGGAVQAVLTVDVPAGLVGADVVNLATVTSAEPEDTPADNVASVTIQPQPPPPPGGAAAGAASAPSGAPADLAVTKTALPRAVGVGQVVAYRIVVTNRGPGSAVGAQVRDTLGPGLELISAPGCSGRRPVVCPIGTLAPGGGVTVTIHARATRAGRLENDAAVSAATPDPSSADDRAVATVTAGSATGQEAGPRLELRYRADHPVVRPGGRVRFTATVRAHGAGVARGARVCLSLPPGLSAARTPTLRQESARACFAIPPLRAGQSRAYSVPAIAEPTGASRTITSIATLEGYGARRREAAVVAVLTSAATSPAVTG